MDRSFTITAEDPLPWAARRECASWLGGASAGARGANRGRKARGRRNGTGLAVSAAMIAGVVVLGLLLWSPPTKADVLSPSTPQTATLGPAAVADAVALNLLDVRRHGSIAEIKGATSLDATVLINGEQVPFIEADGRFTYFLPVPGAGFRITLTAQTRSGASKTLTYTLEND